MMWALAVVAALVVADKVLKMMAPAAEEQGMTHADFLRKITPLAKVIEIQLGIPLEISVTQAAHESNWGNSGLTRKANNLFGITGDSWKAAGKPVVEMPTGEYINGALTSLVRPFRAYGSWLESLKDWGNKIATDKRYASAYQAAKDHNSQMFFTLIARAGYATDPAYGEKLVMVRAAVRREMEALA